MEEELIYELVDCIVNNQDKINELTQNIESPEGNEIYKKEIHYKNNLNANIKRLNKYENEKKLNDKKFQEYTNNFYSKIENIENEIASTSEKLNEFDKNNTNKELYKISYEKFKNIILNKHDKENLKNMNKEYKKINTNYTTISKDMKILDEEKSQPATRCCIFNVFHPLFPSARAAFHRMPTESMWGARRRCHRASASSPGAWNPAKGTVSRSANFCR